METINIFNNEFFVNPDKLLGVFKIKEDDLYILKLEFLNQEVIHSSPYKEKYIQQYIDEIFPRFGSEFVKLKDSNGIVRKSSIMYINKGKARLDNESLVELDMDSFNLNKIKENDN